MPARNPEERREEMTFVQNLIFLLFFLFFIKSGYVPKPLENIISFFFLVAFVLVLIGELNRRMRE
jgi:hypothetical protein